MTTNDPIISWILEGDVSIRFQCYRDLLGEIRQDLQQRIATEGWGKEYLSRRNVQGYWGRGFYQPKWTSSHYTLLELRNLCIPPGNEAINQSIQKIVEHEKGTDGGINPSGTIAQSDVCINGMFLRYACYFGIEQEQLISVIDYLLKQQLPDGGFNCRFNRSGAKHSSLHSTLSVAEGISEYLKNNYSYKRTELKDFENSAREFILMHRLFLSDKTGNVIKSDFLKYPYPSRWKYDILRAMDYFQEYDAPYDDRMEPAITAIRGKQDKEGCWKLPAHYPGEQYFQMEKAGEKSRWNTLRALRVLKHYGN